MFSLFHVGFSHKWFLRNSTKRFIFCETILWLGYCQPQICHWLNPGSATKRPKIPPKEASNGVCASSCGQVAQNNAFGAQPARGGRGVLSFFGVLQMSFSGWQNFEANSINVGFVNIPSNIKHLREDKLSFHSFCTSFFLYNGTSSTPCVRSRSKPRGQSWASANLCRRLSVGYHPFHCLAVCFNLARCAWKIFSVIRQVVNATKIVRPQKHLAAHQGTSWTPRSRKARTNPVHRRRWLV